MNSQLDTGLVFTGTLSVLVESLPALPAEHELQRANESNELLLKTVSVLEDKPEIDEADPVSIELKRQDLKLSLLLDMLGSLLLQNKLLPPLKEIELTTEGIKIQTRDILPDMQGCKISLYIDAHIPKPLILFAHSHPGGQAGIQALTFSGVGQNVKDNLDKFIFRQHRRRVAQTRKA